MKTRPGYIGNSSVRVIHQSPTVYVRTATMIPDGMHAAPETYANEGWRSGMSSAKHRGLVAHHTVRTLVARGIPAHKARGLVHRAVVRLRPTAAPAARGYRGYTSGVGDGATVPADVLQHAQDTQTQHQSLLDQYGAATTDADHLTIRSQIEGLYNDWTAYAVGVEGGKPPVSWNRADPTAAILISIRDDIRNTTDLIDSGKAQVALQKYIQASWADSPPSGPSLPSLNLNLPWYVWAGGTTALAVWLRSVFK